jgi:hypothetical protein
MTENSVAFCRIHPAIGIARVGGSEQYLIGPEVPDQVRVPPDGTAGFKDKDGQLLRQAARFRIYAYDKHGVVLGELAPGGDVDITWSVEVANTKAAWYDFDLAMDIPEFDGSAGTPPQSSKLRNADAPDRTQLAISPRSREIRGRGTQGAQYRFDDGAFFGKSVPLGELRTDDEGHLLFLPAFGHSASKDQKPAKTFANNPGWHDDVADGPVQAVVKVGGKPVPVEHAWVVVAPPDYAPGLIAVVTMYDVVRDAGWQLDSSLMPARPSYQRDILPLFRRLNENQWVNGGFGKLFGWGTAGDLEPLFATLGSDSELSRPLRETMFQRFRSPKYEQMEPDAIPPVYGDGMNVPARDPRQWLAVTDMQYEMLRRWAAGKFIADYDPAPPPQELSKIPLELQPWALDSAALDNAIGGPFHPGCEMTWPMRQPILYEKPFRLKLRAGAAPDYGPVMTSKIVLSKGGPLDGSGPGDVSRWMAVPWQTDTSSCLYAYEGGADVFLPTFWPVRVPNTVLTQEQYGVVTDASVPIADRQEAFAFDNRPFWLRKLPEPSDYEALINAFVAKWNEVGVVTMQPGTPEEDGSQLFPKVMHVELGMDVQPAPMAKVHPMAAAAPEASTIETDHRPSHLPNPRDFR